MHSTKARASAIEATLMRRGRPLRYADPRACGVGLNTMA